MRPTGLSWWAFALMPLKDERKTKKQLIEELEASRGEVSGLRDENVFGAQP